MTDVLSSNPDRFATFLPGFNLSSSKRNNLLCQEISSSFTGVLVHTSDVLGGSGLMYLYCSTFICAWRLKFILSGEWTTREGKTSGHTFSFLSCWSHLKRRENVPAPETSADGYIFGDLFSCLFCNASKHSVEMRKKQPSLHRTALWNPAAPFWRGEEMGGRSSPRLPERCRQLTLIALTPQAEPRREQGSFQTEFVDFTTVKGTTN